jgi:uncharacterized protein
MGGGTGRVPPPFLLDIRPMTGQDINMSTQNTFLTVAITLATGALGAAVAVWLSVPAPYLTGPAILVTLAGLLGLKTHIPDKLRNTVFLVIGLALGSSMTPETLQSAASWPVSLVGMSLGLAVLMLSSSWILNNLFRLEPTTALLASSPGHLSFVLSLGTDTGANVPLISVIQSVRVLVLTLMVPFAIAVFTDVDMAMRAPVGEVISLLHLAALAVLALALGLVLGRIKVPAALLIGAMIVSSIGHGMGWTPGLSPQPLSVMAFTIMGTLIGTRFSGVSGAELRHAALGGLVTTMLGLVLSGIFAAALSWLTGIRLIDMVIALAPGGLETMIAMAALMDADPAFVAIHHITRLFFLSVFVPLVLFMQKRGAKG